jgi:hypothetical protein
MQNGRRNAGTAEPADYGVRSEAELARDDQWVIVAGGATVPDKISFAAFDNADRLSCCVRR